MLDFCKLHHGKKKYQKVSKQKFSPVHTKLQIVILYMLAFESQINSNFCSILQVSGFIKYTSEFSHRFLACNLTVEIVIYYHIASFAHCMPEDSTSECSLVNCS